MSQTSSSLPSVDTEALNCVVKKVKEGKVHRIRNNPGSGRRVPRKISRK